MARARGETQTLQVEVAWKVEETGQGKGKGKNGGCASPVGMYKCFVQILQVFSGESLVTSDARDFLVCEAERTTNETRKHSPLPEGAKRGNFQ